MIRINETEIAWKPGINIQTILEKINDDNYYPLVRIRMPDGTSRHIMSKDFGTYEIPDNITVYPIPLVAGG